MKNIDQPEPSSVWADSFDRDEKDVLSIQREVATRIASSLSLELLPGRSSAETAKNTQPEAYDAYLKGRYLITKDNPDDLERSIPYFDQAIAADPDFAPAYAAEVEAWMLENDWSERPHEETLSKAKTAALKAVELDPAYAEGYDALGSVQFWLEWDAQTAELNFRKAIELNPNNPLTRLNYGRCLLAKGDTELAINEINEALRLDPVSLLTTGLAAYTQLQAGRYDEAIALSNRMLELEPKSWAARECLFRSYVNKGDYQKALEVTRDRMSMNGDKPEDIKRLDDGDPKSVIENRFKKHLGYMTGSFQKGDKVWMMYGAWLSVKLGDRDLAFDWLERAAANHESFIVYLNVDPIWDPIRSDPRFEALKLRVRS